MKCADDQIIEGAPIGLTLAGGAGVRVEARATSALRTRPELREFRTGDAHVFCEVFSATDEWSAV